MTSVEHRVRKLSTATAVPHCVPPAPEVMAALYEEYRRRARGLGITFQQYLAVIGYSNPADGLVGMDDAAVLAPGDEHPELISIPAQPITGELRVKVLLIDFADRVGTRPPAEYEELLLSKDSYPTGSMRDFFAEVTLGSVNVTGSVHGWLRMPEAYSYYTNGESGLNPSSYPRNARRMAEDAVQAALDDGVVFEPQLDILNNGAITALFIVHAGDGAETLSPSVRGHDIWSHKWTLPHSIEVANGLRARTYLVVPQRCKVGVCAHELGHLAFQWEDFYDPNYDQDGKEWDGSGSWDLMAGGSYNGNGESPAHPAALHKVQHGWIEVEQISGPAALTLPAYSATAGKAVKITSPAYRPGQYLLLENRSRVGFDSTLPGEGLLVWRVDERQQMVAPDHPALQLVQADGKHQLETPGDWNQGDAGDPFPGVSARTTLLSAGNISTSFPDGDDSGISLRDIRRDAVSGEIALDVHVDGVAPPPTDEPVIRQEAQPGLAIPDNDPRGVGDTITIDQSGVVSDLAVDVDIRHTYVGDLRVELIAPSGERAVLHERSGGGADDIQRKFNTATDPQLARLIGNPVGGDWRLQITDLAAYDTGTLDSWAIELEVDSREPVVSAEVSPALAIPDYDVAGVSSAITVARAGRIRSVTVGVDVTHTYVGDLRVELISPTGERAILHDRSGGAADNLNKTYISSTDAALATFVGGPVKGSWVLRVSDLARRDGGTLDSWSLGFALATSADSVEVEATPRSTSPTMTPAGLAARYPLTKPAPRRRFALKWRSPIPTSAISAWSCSLHLAAERCSTTARAGEPRTSSGRIAPALTIRWCRLWASLLKVAGYSVLPTSRGST